MRLAGGGEWRLGGVGWGEGGGGYCVILKNFHLAWCADSRPMISCGIRSVSACSAAVIHEAASAATTDIYIHLYPYTYLYLSIYLSIHLSFYLCIYASIYIALTLLHCWAVCTARVDVGPLHRA